MWCHFVARRGYTNCLWSMSHWRKSGWCSISLHLLPEGLHLFISTLLQMPQECWTCSRCVCDFVVWPLPQEYDLSHTEDINGLHLGLGRVMSLKASSFLWRFVLHAIDLVGHLEMLPMQLWLRLKLHKQCSITRAGNQKSLMRMLCKLQRIHKMVPTTIRVKMMEDINTIKNQVLGPLFLSLANREFPLEILVWCSYFMYALFVKTVNREECCLRICFLIGCRFSDFFLVGLRSWSKYESAWKRLDYVCWFARVLLPSVNWFLLRCQHWFVLWQ